MANFMRILLFLRLLRRRTNLLKTSHSQQLTAWDSRLAYLCNNICGCWLGETRKDIWLPRSNHRSILLKTRGCVFFFGGGRRGLGEVTETPSDVCLSSVGNVCQKRLKDRSIVNKTYDGYLDWANWKETKKSNRTFYRQAYRLSDDLMHSTTRGKILSARRSAEEDMQVLLINTIRQSAAFRLQMKTTATRKKPRMQILTSTVFKSLSSLVIRFALCL